MERGQFSFFSRGFFSFLGSSSFDLAERETALSLVLLASASCPPPPGAAVRPNHHHQLPLLLLNPPLPINRTFSFDSFNQICSSSDSPMKSDDSLKLRPLSNLSWLRLLHHHCLLLVVDGSSRRGSELLGVSGRPRRSLE